jgi:phosphatidylserine/phosphatidylglycerophosphate/cardiolipin synthase-like enzyme
VVAFAAGLYSASFVSEPPNNNSPSLDYSQALVAFCPSAECTTLPISAIDAAQTRVDVAMYSFTNPDFSDALIRAHARGLVVRVMVEKQQAGSKYSQHEELSAAGVRVRIDSNPNYMHHKFAVIDSDKIINGSMNWTGNGVGENNENVSVIYSPELNALFESEFEKVWNDSDAFGGV